MDGAAYEVLVSTLMTKLQPGSAFDRYELRSGSRNRVLGVSGYKHQIDVSLEGDGKLFLIEAKHWSKSVGVETVLTLASRAVDIRLARPQQRIFALIASSKRPTRGATLLARQFAIELDRVDTPEEFSLRLADQVFVGIKESANATDTVSASITRRCASCGASFLVQDNESHCTACRDA